MGQTDFRKIFLGWWPAHGARWALAFAALYALLFLLNDLLSSWFDVVDDRIALVFLPAFVRVAAVVVAKLAGVVGLFIGAFVISLLYGDSLGVALGISLVSACGILIAYLILLQAMGLKSLPLSLPVLLMLTFLYAPLNAVLHALAWDGFGLSAGITVVEIAYMMLGDLMGVVLIFLLLRIGMRGINAFKRPGRV